MTKKATFPYALKSFLGYLEGTHKAEHTIKNYRLDLLAFESFLQSEAKGRPGKQEIQLDQLTMKDVERFHDALKTQGLKTNTRRRKLLTVRRFLAYLVNRNKLPEELGKKIPTPHKIERVPLTVSSEELVNSILKLPRETLLDERNRVLFWTMAETGCQVAEVAQLRFESFEGVTVPAGGPGVHVGGKAERILPISPALAQAVLELKTRSGDSPWMFSGFNRFGSLGSAISSRGVELLVKFYAARLGQGELTPRTFRHSVVLRWHREGCSREEIQRRLGLKTAYAFRAYEVLFKSSSETTSNAENYPR